jgi:hypothetical protein
VLHNGAKNTAVVGPVRSLYGLVTALRKIRAPAGADQSKIPYSQRKNVFSMRLLVVNAGEKIGGIRQVVAIAATNPDYPTIFQWTGGRAGCHHSYEDFH